MQRFPLFFICTGWDNRMLLSRRTIVPQSTCSGLLEKYGPDFTYCTIECTTKDPRTFVGGTVIDNGIFRTVHSEN